MAQFFISRRFFDEQDYDAIFEFRSLPFARIHTHAFTYLIDGTKKESKPTDSGVSHTLKMEISSRIYTRASLVLISGLNCKKKSERLFCGHVKFTLPLFRSTHFFLSFCALSLFPFEL